MRNDPCPGPCPLARREMLSGIAAVAAITWANVARSAIPEEVRIAEFGQPIDIGDIAPGQWRHVEVEGSPVFIRRLTKSQIEEANAHAADGSSGQHTEEAEWVIVSGLCTHASCRIVAGLGPYKGWMCFCHGSEYDVYGHIRRGPAKYDLPTVPHVIKDGRLILLAQEER
jgi:ubiquinol-cytochrome c reductase iron-sulfur subunit